MCRQTLPEAFAVLTVGLLAAKAGRVGPLWRQARVSLARIGFGGEPWPNTG